MELIKKKRLLAIGRSSEEFIVTINTLNVEPTLHDSPKTERISRCAMHIAIKYYL